ncbi:hypothetical protein [Methanobacterium subterraneum]|nr:hypothetical protein [Methanobacterium subterraneum]
MNCIVSLVSGRIYDDHGPKLVISSGLAIMCISMVLLPVFLPQPPLP